MTIQLSTLARNAKLNAIESELGSSPVLKLRTGTQPANCAATDSGSVVATMTLPADAMADAASGIKGKAGTWEVASAAGSGTAIGHFRIYKSDGATCVLQGSCGLSAADMNLDAVVVNAGQKVTITQFDLTEGNS